MCHTEHFHKFSDISEQTAMLNSKNFKAALKMIAEECTQVSSKRLGQQSVLMRKKSMECLAENNIMTDILEEMNERFKFESCYF